MLIPQIVKNQVTFLYAGQAQVSYQNQSLGIDEVDVHLLSNLNVDTEFMGSNWTLINSRYEEQDLILCFVYVACISSFCIPNKDRVHLSHFQGKVHTYPDFPHVYKSVRLSQGVWVPSIHKSNESPLLVSGDEVKLKAGGDLSVALYTQDAMEQLCSSLKHP